MIRDIFCLFPSIIIIIASPKIFFKVPKKFYVLKFFYVLEFFYVSEFFKVPDEKKHKFCLLSASLYIFLSSISAPLFSDRHITGSYEFHAVNASLQTALEGIC